MTLAPKGWKQRLAAAVRRARIAWDPDYDADGERRMPLPPIGEQPKPPWLTYPGNPPEWGGWRQGVSEGWLFAVWLPFWRGRTFDERAAYLARWPPPDDEWRDWVAQLSRRLRPTEEPAR